jgi:hypothetical protein
VLGDETHLIKMARFYPLEHFAAIPILSLVSLVIAHNRIQVQISITSMHQPIHDYFKVLHVPNVKTLMTEKSLKLQTDEIKIQATSPKMPP